jgi:hypothetical protein
MADIPQFLLLLTAQEHTPKTSAYGISSLRRFVPSRARRHSPPLLAAPKPAKVVPHIIPANSDWGGVIVPWPLAALKPDRREVKPRVLYWTYRKVRGRTSNFGTPRSEGGVDHVCSNGKGRTSNPRDRNCMEEPTLRCQMMEVRHVLAYRDSRPQ